MDGSRQPQPLGIHRGYLRKYGGFLFKQWKEKFLLVADGSLLICRDAQSPAELGISLGTSCQAILEGREMGSLPRLPLGAQRDSCLGLRLTDGRCLLLLAPDSQECRQWLSILRKVKESFSPAAPARGIGSPARRCCWKEAGGGGCPGPESRAGTGGTRSLGCPRPPPEPPSGLQPCRWPSCPARLAPSLLESRPVPAPEPRCLAPMPLRSGPHLSAVAPILASLRPDPHQCPPPGASRARRPARPVACATDPRCTRG
ncbi:uncharacterized protein LOC142823883 isoform X1 [Pelodiscus sinensis]|uniref:uncharacterized protein LOC142823883 isoform X1 n=1 Tax=Pelodiscus sinensis TaxID=13735 RepID=UPI003F6B7C69